MADEKLDVNEYLSRGWLHCNVVLEMVGKPQEHVEKTLRLLLKRLDGEKEVRVIRGEVHKPKAQGEFFSSFVEMEALLNGLPAFTMLCFQYMPSSIEILAPSDAKLPAQRITDFFNDLLAHLHDVDMRFKNTNAANTLLDRNLHSILRNFVMLILEGGQATLAAISGKTGIKEAELKPFLQRFVQDGVIREDHGSYRRVR